MWSLETRLECSLCKRKAALGIYHRREMISVELLWDARSLADWQATQNQPEPDLETTDITELADKLTRVLGWLSEGDTIERLGMRCAILLYCVRPDFLPEQSLHLISGTTKQNLSKMVTDFKVSSKGVSQQFLTMTHVSQSGSELRGWSAAAAELENARALR